MTAFGRGSILVAFYRAIDAWALHPRLVSTPWSTPTDFQSVSLERESKSGCPCVFHHRNHVIWPTKYRYKVLQGGIRLRVRDSCRQVCRENEVDIIRGVPPSDPVHLFVSVPPKLAVSDLVRLMKGWSSHKVQHEGSLLRKCYRGRWFWGRGYFSSTSGAITEDIVPQDLQQHIANPTGASWSMVLVGRVTDADATVRRCHMVARRQL